MRCIATMLALCCGVAVADGPSLALAVLRLVIRAGFSRDMADVLLEDMERAVDWFERLDAPMPSPHQVQPSFHH